MAARRDDPAHMNHHSTETKVVLFMRPALWISLFLIAATLVVYWEVQNHEFINYDDPPFITDNRLVQSALTLESIKSAFEPNWGYWKPVAYLSLMLDYQIYGLDSGGFHRTNLLFHIANALLLFVLLRRITGATWQSGFVAALFALHPLHVESVAWVTERKDVLSTFFWFLTILAYVRYLKQPDFKRYLLILVALGLGLMAKPMLVTLPFVLLLFDYWPLGRLQLPQKSNRQAQPVRHRLPPGNERPAFRMNNSTNSLHRFIRSLSRLIWEKVPMFCLVALSIWIVFWFTARNQVIQAVQFESLGFRASNALISYVTYIARMFWPENLAIPYPYTIVSWPRTALSFLILLCISLAAVKTVKSRPYFAVGWLWYLGTLVPVIGVVHFGEFARADRFTYVPLIGLFIIIAWGVPELLAQWKNKPIFLALLTAGLLITLMAITWRQVGYWKNSITLFQHALEATTNNTVAHNNLGNALSQQGRTTEAIDHFLQALRIKPDHAKAHNNLGIALAKQDRIDEAIEHYSQALRIKPDYVEAHNNLGIDLVKQDRMDEAVEHYLAALRIDPEFAEAHSNLGAARDKQGRTAEAIDHYLQALRIKPDYVVALNNLASALYKQGQTAEAIARYLEALRINPDYVEAHNNLGIALVKQDRIDEAVEHYSTALGINPDYVEAHNNLGVALFRKGNIDMAIVHFRTALRIKPDHIKATNNLDKVLKIQRQNED